MIDKQIQDPCNKCDVEPPALKFKCPTCEHNKENKQILIDGVDVSGCTKYEHEIIRCNTSLKNMCFYGGRCTDKRNADCYYKQLKRKEQECNELRTERKNLKWDLENNIQVKNHAMEEINQLKAENDDYIKVIEHLKTIIKDFTQEMVKLRQTIAEIEDICGIGIVNGLSEEQYLSELRNWQTQILNKISEVENG